MQCSKPTDSAAFWSLLLLRGGGGAQNVARRYLASWRQDRDVGKPTDRCVLPGEQM